MKILIIFQKKFMDFNFDFYCLTRFLSVLPFHLLLVFLISILVMKIPTLKAKQSRCCNYPANEALGGLPPLLAEISESFYYCCLFLGSLLLGGINMMKYLFIKGTRVQEFENYCFIYIYKINFSFSLL